MSGVSASRDQPDDQHWDALEGLLQLWAKHQPHDRGEVDTGEEQGLHERQEGGKGVWGGNQVMMEFKVITCG